MNICTEIIKEKRIDQIENLLEKNKLNLADKKIECFKGKYSNDISFLLLCFELYVKNGNVIKAKDIYHKTEGKIKISKDLFLEFFLLCYQTENYKTAYSLLPKLSINSRFDSKDLRRLELTLKNKLGIEHDKKKLTYCEEQLMKYSFDKAIQNMNNIDCDEFSFSENIYFCELFQTIKMNLPTAIMGQSSLVLDVYIFDYPDIGFNCNISNNYLKVITVRGTHDILFMIPTANLKNDCVNEIEYTIDKSKLKAIK